MGCVCVSSIVEELSIFSSFVGAKKQSVGQIYQVHWGSGANRYSGGFLIAEL